MNIQYNKQSGFTLLEVLVATIIASFVAVIAASSLRAVSINKDQILYHSQASSELKYITNLIKQDLNNIVRDNNVNNINFYGEQSMLEGFASSKLVFRTINTIKARPTGIEGDVYEVDYSMESNGENFTLIRRLWPNPDATEPPGGVITIISQNILSFEVQYFDGQDWLSEWDREMTSLPTMVQVTLMLKTPETNDVLQSNFTVYFSRWPQQNFRPGNERGGQGGQRGQR